MDAILGALQLLTPVELAGRIFLSICLLALPLSVWFFVREVRNVSDLPVVWAFILSYNAFFLFGFIGYCLSIAGCFAVLGLWLWYLNSPNALRWCGLVVALTILYSLHLYGFAMAGVIITAYALLRGLPRSKVLLSWIPFVPGCLLYATSQTRIGVTHTVEFANLSKKAGWVLAFLGVHLRQTDPIDPLIYGGVFLFVALAFWKNRDVIWDRCWIGVAALMFAVYWLLPANYGIAVSADIRILPFTLIVILAGIRFGRREQSLLIVAAILFGVRMAAITHEFVIDQPRLAELARSFEATPPNSRVLPLVELGTTRSLLFKPTKFWGYGVIHRAWLSPYLFSDPPGVHPLHPYTQPYPSYGTWSPQTEARINWKLVCESYDYIWALDVPYLSPRLHEIGDVVFMGDGLELYRIHHRPARCQ